MGIDLNGRKWNASRRFWDYASTCAVCGEDAGYMRKERAENYVCPRCARIKRYKSKLSEDQEARVLWDSEIKVGHTYKYIILCPRCLRPKEKHSRLLQIDTHCRECTEHLKSVDRLTEEQASRVLWDTEQRNALGRKIFQIRCVGCGELKDSLQSLSSVDRLCRSCAHERSRIHMGFTNVDYENTQVNSYGQTIYPISCPVCGKPKGMATLSRALQPCRACAVSSKGEERISAVLGRLGIPYERERAIPNPHHPRPLYLDFYLTTHSVAVEYDGELHFGPIAFFGGEDKYRRRQRCDLTKDQYCKDNNTPLIRISHWDYDRIEDILTEELTKLGVLRGSSFHS